MPELPEVETIKRQLNLLAAGKKIKLVEILLPKIVKAPIIEFKKAVEGAKIKEFSRRAKILIIKLNNGWCLLLHLKLSGQLIYQLTVNSQQLTTKNKYTHVIFNFTDGSRLIFNDMLQFGYIKLLPTDEIDNFFKKERFGPEPFDKNFTLPRFMVILDKKPNAKIKQFLMDQKNIAGIGNIYADEILFASRVNPLRKINDLKPSEIKAIYKNIRKILSEAIRAKGTSVKSYLDAYGQEGNFLKKLKVYGREEKKCVKCKGKIKRLKIGGRSAHFCPACQK